MQVQSRYQPPKQPRSTKHAAQPEQTQPQFPQQPKIAETPDESEQVTSKLVTSWAQCYLTDSNQSQ
jgi:hypothetical protein